MKRSYPLTDKNNAKLLKSSNFIFKTLGPKSGHLSEYKNIINS